MQAERDSYVAQVGSPDHGEHWSGPPDMSDRIADVLGTSRHHRVLDLGCGVGGPARRLAGRVGCRVIGLEVMEPVAAAAARWSAGVPEAPVAYVVGRAERPPFRDEAFDQVWCLGVVAHIRERRRLAQEVRRVLRPGGLAAVTEAFWDGVREPRFCRSAPPPWYPVTTEVLLRALAAAGLEDTRALPWPGGPANEGDVRDRNLRADLLDGRLRSEMVVAWRP